MEFWLRNSQQRASFILVLPMVGPSGETPLTLSSEKMLLTPLLRQSPGSKHMLPKHRVADFIARQVATYVNKCLQPSRHVHSAEVTAAAAAKLADSFAALA